MRLLLHFGLSWNLCQLWVILLPVVKLNGLVEKILTELIIAQV